MLSLYILYIIVCIIYWLGRQADLVVIQIEKNSGEEKAEEKERWWAISDERVQVVALLSEFWIIVEFFPSSIMLGISVYMCIFN